MIKKTTAIPAGSKLLITKRLRLSLPIESKAKYLNLVLGDTRSVISQHLLPNELDKLDKTLASLEWNPDGIINQTGIYLGEFLSVYNNPQLVDLELKSMLSLLTSLIEIFQVNTVKYYNLDQYYINPETLLYQTSLLIGILRVDNIGKSKRYDVAYREHMSLETFKRTNNYKFIDKYIAFLASFIASYTKLNWELLFEEILKYEVTPSKVKQRDSSNAYKEK